MFYLNICNNSTWEEVNDSCNGDVILADHLEDDKSDQQIPISAELLDGDPEALYGNNDDDDDSITEAKQGFRKVFQLPLKCYYELNYEPQKSYVLVVGGETHGLSEQAFEFAARRNGCRVHVPLAGFVNSLNAATAVGIVSFEMKKQMT